MTLRRTEHANLSHKDTLPGTALDFARNLLRSGGVTFAAIALCVVGSQAVQASDFSFNPGAHLTFAMPLGGSAERDMNVSLDIHNGHRRIVSFGLRSNDGNTGMRIGEESREHWRVSYQRLLDEERTSPGAATDGGRQNRNSTASTGQRRRAAAREHYLVLLERYESSSPTQQRALYRELVEAYHAALESR